MMDIVSESINLATQYFLVRPNIKDVVSLRYKVHDTNSSNDVCSDFVQEDI